MRSETLKLAFSVKEAAEALAISPWTLRAYLAQGKLRRTRIGRRVVVEKSELQRLLAAGRDASHAQ